MPLVAPLVVPVTSFEPAPFDILQEIKVVVRASDDEYTATFFDANVNAGGCTEVEAVENLKDILVSRFEYLDKQPADKLSPPLTKQIAVLRKFMRRRV